nr:AMP-binding protein [Mycolicibacterium komossense]
MLQDGDPSLYLIGRRYRFHPLERPAFLAALRATVLENPVQLCVLEASQTEFGYPDLVPRLQLRDVVREQSDAQCQRGSTDVELSRTWESGIIAKPLVRYTVRTDPRGDVSGLDVHAHHILLDGGATGLIEADLARHLGTGRSVELPSAIEGLGRLTQAHQREATRVAESLERLAEMVQRELEDQARHGGYGQHSSDTPGTVAKGVLRESVGISGDAYDAIVTLSEVEQIPLNVLVAAAAVAVDAGLRQSAESLLVHAVDNRFGEPDLNVATCLVNSVAQVVRFPAFASVADVARILDRGYVKALRRRWLREEHYRRRYLAINRTSHVEALALNFLREPCAPELRPYMAESPVTTDIGPVEGLTVASVLDEEQRTLNLSIWSRADLPESTSHVGIAERMSAVLEAMPAMWQSPLAMTVGEWFGLTAEGQIDQGDSTNHTEQTPISAWFLDRSGGVGHTLEKRPGVYRWVAWLAENGAEPGDVVVLTDDDTDKTVDLLIASHLAGCGYSVCDTADEVGKRANSIAEQGGAVATHIVAVAATVLSPGLDRERRRIADRRIEQVAHDTELAGKTAYIMATSGSTGAPKLVRVSHGSLALFCDAIRASYGWGPQDTILQCAPLTSDISVEEIFCGAFCGSEFIRSTAIKMGDLPSLAADLVDKGPTVVDLPTAVWHLLCEDVDAMEMVGRSRLRQIVIGGEAIRPAAVDKWMDSAASQRMSLLSTYGPTEATVVVTYLPVVCDGSAIPAGARLRLGRPITPDTVFIAFGEVVIVGDLVSSGYLGSAGGSFGAVHTADGSRRRAFATADRVIVDEQGFPVFAGRRDAIVKISGKRVDTAEVTRRISEDPAVADVAVALHNGGLGVWFETHRTREGVDDPGAATRIRLILVSLRVSSFFVLGVPSIPRKANGKVDSESLWVTTQLEAIQGDAGSGEKAAGLAQIWSRHLGRVIEPDSSLVDEGIGSLDLIRILPDTRAYLGRHLLILDLISADTAANLVDDEPHVDTWMDAGTAAEIEHDFGSLPTQSVPDGGSVKRASNHPADQAILVLGASGILGTGFAQAVLELRRAGVWVPEVVLATRSALPERDPWVTLRDVDGVRVEQISAGFSPEELGELIGDVGAGTVVNCIGNTNVVVPYRDLRSANVKLVSAMVEACSSWDARLVQLSTFVVNSDVTAPRVTDPRSAPYPYAASKSLAELVVARSPHELDFTIVRLPRVLGEPDQLRDSADILASIVDACIALRGYPAVNLIEQVTTGRAAAAGILGLLPEVAGPVELGRGITVVRGAAVNYAQFLSAFTDDEVDVAQWKERLDQSDWAKRNPRRWSAIDAWITLGMRLGTRTYSEYLAEYPTVDLGIEAVDDLDTTPHSLRTLLTCGLSHDVSEVVC